MPDYAHRIKELTDVRSRAVEECENQRRLIGQRVLQLEEAQRPEASADLVTRHQAIAERVESASSAIERMIHIDERQAEIREQMKTLQKERDDTFRGLESVYEQVGAVAFRLFKQHPLIDAGYSSAFQALARYQDDIRSIDGRMDRINAEPASGKRSVVERIGAKSRSFFLKNRRTVRENQLPKLLQETGRALAGTEFVSEMDDEELNHVSQPLLAAEERRAAIDASLTALREESGRLVAEFNSLSEGKKLPRARKDREAEIESARGEMNQLLQSLGRTAVSDPPEALSDELHALEECEKRTAHFDELIRRLQAGHKAELLNAEIAELAKKQDDVRARIEEQQKELERLGTQEQNQRQEQARLEAERGDVTDLFDQ